MAVRGERLAGKVAIVTGAGASGEGVGVGQAISILMAREGAKVILVDNNLAAAQKTLEMIESEGGEAAVYIGDAASAECSAGAVLEAEKRYGYVTTLVNNVAISGRSDLTDCDEELWDRVLDVNLKSTMFFTGRAIPSMEKAGGGSVVNIGSTAALRAYPTQTAYTASKGGMVALTSLWAVEQGRKNVRVNCICPGSIYTPLAERSSVMSEESRRRRALLTALGEEGTAWDIAWAALFLASDEARWITGVTLPVDGGSIIGTPQWGASVSAAGM